MKGLVFGEAWQELRASLRGPFLPAFSVAIVAYLAMVLLNGRYLQEMGAVDIPRNSPHIVFMMVSAEAIYLYLGWAWIFSRVVTRDRDANLHEIVLASPVSLRALLVGRYLGAVGAALLLGAVCPLSFLVVHPLAAAGALSDLGPVPWAAMLQSWLLFCVPSAIGVGALCLAVALRTKSAGGPVGAAALLVGLWMVAMVVVRGGDMDPGMATVMDPTGYAEVEQQTTLWTPAEKATRLLSLTAPLLVNRALWCLLPLLVVGVALARVSREYLVVDRPSAKVRGKDRVQAPPAAVAPAALGGAPRRNAWALATLTEAGWHLRLAMSGWGFRLTATLLFAAGVVAAFANVVAHGEGPLVPRPELVSPMLGEGTGLVIAFIVAGFVGSLMRRDERPGFSEMVAVTPAPLGVRLLGRAVAALVVTLLITLVPAASGYVVVGLFTPGGWSVATPFLHSLLVYGPALVQVCALTMALHALVRHAGAAHGLVMVAVFMVVVAEDSSLVTYPPAQLALPIPPRISLSELVGWAPWLPLASAQAALKLSVFVFVLGLAWLVWPRALVDSPRQRASIVARRLRQGGAATLLSVAIIAGALLATLLHQRLVVAGEYQSGQTRDAQGAAWERNWLGRATPLSVEGGEVRIRVDPANRTVRGTWRIKGLRIAPGSHAELHAELPAGVEVVSATVAGVAARVEVRDEHVSVELPDCASHGCDIELDLQANVDGWPVAGKTPWLHARQVWLRATDFLPRLGIDPRRSLTDPRLRARFGLPDAVPRVPSRASVALTGAAPPGDWKYRVELPEGWSTPRSGETHGVLDFAVAWRPTPPTTTVGSGVPAWHGASHDVAARDVLGDVELARTCIAELTGWAVAEVDGVLQAPRGSALWLHDGLLWMPEDAGWDIAGGGVGGWLRRYELTRTLAAATLLAQADIRDDPGSNWIAEGVPGWLALECTLTHDGLVPFESVVQALSDRTLQSFGAIDHPVRGIAEDAGSPYVAPYSALATFAWARTVETKQALQVIRGVVADVQRGEPIRTAMVSQLGAEDTDLLLGMPLATDARLSREASIPTASVRRWRWHAGGWRELSLDSGWRVIRVDAQGVDVLPALALRNASQPFVILDAYPAFERAPVDNGWSTRK